MAALRWLYTAADGTLRIVASAPLATLAREGWTTPDQVRALVLGKDIPADATDVQEMPEDWTPPADRTFRNAWRAPGRSAEGVACPDCPAVVVDMPAARDLHRAWLRRKRITALADLDRDYLRADEQGDPAAKRAVVAQKQRWRDAPADPRIDAATTPDVLRAVWPLEGA